MGCWWLEGMFIPSEHAMTMEDHHLWKKVDPSSTASGHTYLNSRGPSNVIFGHSIQINTLHALKQTKVQKPQSQSSNSEQWIQQWTPSMSTLTWTCHKTTMMPMSFRKNTTSMCVTFLLPHAMYQLTNPELFPHPTTIPSTTECRLDAQLTFSNTI